MATAMGVVSENGLTIVGVISAIVLVSSLTLGFVLHDDEQLSFSIDDDSMMNDVNQISSLGPVSYTHLTLPTKA